VGPEYRYQFYSSHLLCQPVPERQLPRVSCLCLLVNAQPAVKKGRFALENLDKYDTSNSNSDTSIAAIVFRHTIWLPKDSKFSRLSGVKIDTTIAAKTLC